MDLSTTSINQSQLIILNIFVKKTIVCIWFNWDLKQDLSKFSPSDILHAQTKGQ